MAIEPAQAVLPTAAETAASSADLTARNAGSGTPVATNSAENPSTQTTLTDRSAGDDAAPSSAAADSVLAGLNSTEDFQRFAQGLPPLPKEPAPASEPTGATDAAAEEEATLDAEDAAQLEAGAPLPKRLRIGSLPEDRQRAILALADPNRSMEEVLRAFAAASPSDPNAPAAPGEEPTAEIAGIDPAAMTPPKESSEAVRARLADLRKQRSDALRSAELERAADLDEEIGELENHLPEVRQAEQTYDSAYDRAWEASAQQALSVYPDARNADSALAKEMVRLDQQLIKGNDPMQHHPDRPMLLAARAAANLGIAPRAKSKASAAAAVPLKASPVSVPTPRAIAPGPQPPAPAPGGARTQAPSTAAAQAQVDQTLASIKDTASMQEFLRTF
jgi:hypothetical protein